jgi:hypothetical protein
VKYISGNLTSARFTDPDSHVKYVFPETRVASFKSTGVTKTSDLYSGKVFYAMESFLLTPEEGNA